MHRLLARGFRFGLMMAGFALPQAYGAVVSYSNLATWEAATSGFTTLTFDGIAPAGGFVFESPTFTLSGVTFETNSGAGTFLFVISSTYAGTGYSLGSGDALNVQHSGGQNIVAITLPSNTTAFGFDYADSVDPGGLAVALSTGDNFNLSMTSSAKFFGITSTTAVPSLTLSTSATFDVIDNFRFGAAVATPEPSSGLLLAVGILTLAWKRLRRQSTSRG